MPLQWKDHFREGISAFRSLDYDKALHYFDAAIMSGGEHYTLYDSRAAVYEKMGKGKNALKDSRKVIELAPHVRHGYTRSARVFLSLGKHDHALEMAQLALCHIKDNDTVHRLEIEGLRRAIVEARDMCAAAEAQNQSHITKLPVELVSEVFLLASEMDIGSPVRVSLVSSRWRTIALSNHKLWSCLNLSNVRPALKMKLWQERSKQQIKCLRIHPTISGLQLREAYANCAPSFFAGLKILHCDLDSLQSSLTIIPNLRLDEIKVTNIRRNTVGSISPSTALPTRDTSNLRSITVEYANLEWTEIVPGLASLQTLIIRTELELPSTALIFSLLRNNPSLEEVVLEAGLPWKVLTQGENGRIQLLKLTQLQLLGPVATTLIISQIFVPALKELSISQCHHKVDHAIFALDPSFPALTQLSIRKCSFSEDHLVSFLRLMQNLSKLDITHSWNRMDIVVDAIAGKRDGIDGEVVCPDLQHVDFSHNAILNGGPIVRLVKSRLGDMVETPDPSRRLPTRIKTLKIDGCPKIDPSVPKWLRGRIDHVSCVYMTKEDIKKTNRRQGLYQ